MIVCICTHVQKNIYFSRIESINTNVWINLVPSKTAIKLLVLDIENVVLIYDNSSVNVVKMKSILNELKKMCLIFETCLGFDCFLLLFPKVMALLEKKVWKVEFVGFCWFCWILLILVVFYCFYLISCWYITIWTRSSVFDIIWMSLWFQTTWNRT